MALGTLMGGWRIVRTMGSRITRLTPMQGFCAETGGAATLFIATAFGVPVSTTHTITGRHYRGRGGPADLRRALERGELDRLRLGDHDFRFRRRGLGKLLAGLGLALGSVLN